MTVEAEQHIVTKPRPQAIAPLKPIQEIRSTHSAPCPFCGSEIRVKVGYAADVFNACRHFRGIEQRGEVITVEFEQAAAA